MTKGIPVIDIAPALAGSLEDRKRVAREIDHTCTETGFFTITGHGVDTALIDALRSTAHAFFALPLDEKRRAIHPVADTPRGYRALGIEALAHGNDRPTPPDLKEYYHFGRERWPDEPYYTSAEGRRYFIPNLWPERPEGFAAVAERYYAEMERLVLCMMRLTALAHDLDETFFDDKIDRHITAMRLNFYPEQTGAPAPDQMRAGAHTDYGLLTILNGENVPGGLQVLTRGGEWIDVETDPGNFVVNIGDLLMRWTNDRWVSNTHRVINPPAELAAKTKRLSIAFFHHPNYDARVECIAPPGKAKYPPVLSGEYRDLKYRQTRVSAA
ncbi:isopenicillin N synthase family oxygenase [Azospirillum sp. RWY-5-1]|uniref:2-oxoglutarate-dependent ethylene/succinate-forming enzyme n=1 Tax=Azospirillum oleiclasticum TaxID=2735135 RepID=A0ABX2T6L1_9PROT|nr:isopenicillin N synthase family oxygenase [Azospirillum oleiclasticum]NYZ12532.1 isopenicillin N synthase family oxygenase [Azospirillum oleiclasticum]NYZ19692.1 isopenicillin N synthase family oxygenase [Azospirillum oleiclasticum]